MHTIVHDTQLSIYHLQYICMSIYIYILILCHREKKREEKNKKRYTTKQWNATQVGGLSIVKIVEGLVYTWSSRRKGSGDNKSFFFLNYF